MTSQRAVSAPRLIVAWLIVAVCVAIELSDIVSAARHHSHYNVDVFTVAGLVALVCGVWIVARTRLRRDR